MGKLRLSRMRSFWSSEKALPGWRWGGVIWVSRVHWREVSQILSHRLGGGVAKSPRAEAAGFCSLSAKVAHS